MLRPWSEANKDQPPMSDMLEKMVINLLKNMGFDPDMLKNEVQSRVVAFENNIHRLNSHLGTINSRLENIEKHLGIEKLTGVTANDANGSEDNQRLAIEGPIIGEPKLSPEYQGPAT
jgi:hypothetical protein